MTMAIDLHQLVNTPGFGKAVAEIKKSGNWDKFADCGGELRKFTVHLTASMPVTKTLSIEARCVEEAEELAESKASSISFPWDYDDGAFDIEAVAQE